MSFNSGIFLKGILFFNSTVISRNKNVTSRHIDYLYLPKTPTNLRLSRIFSIKPTRGIVSYFYYN